MYRTPHRTSQYGFHGQFEACRHVVFAGYCSLIALALATGNVVQAETPVDRSEELQLISSDFGLADGPAWDGSWALYVPDVKQSLVKRFVPSKNQWQTVAKGEHRISASFFSHGRLFVSNNSGARIEAFTPSAFHQGVETVHLIEESSKPEKRPNDLVVDQHGGIYFTLTKQNQVVYVSPDGKSAHVSTEAVLSPNGITMSPDNQTLYVAAYRPKKIYSLPILQPGQLGNAKEFAVMDDGEALGADGMTIDRAGNVYCAGATDVWIWNPDGKLLDRISCPTRPINCTFGDQDMRSLYITGFGGLYRQRMNAYGIAAAPAVAVQQTDGSTIPDTSIPDEIAAHLNVVYAQYGTRRLLADIFEPNAAAPARAAVVVVHGGGWLKGDKTKFRALAIDLAKRGYVSAAIEYRLGHEARFPAGIHDCNAAVRFLRANAETYNIDPGRIAAVGGSAGGHLVGLMASGSENSFLQGDGGNSDQSSRLQLAIVMAGPLQIATGSVADRSLTAADSNAVHWFGGTIQQQLDLYQQADAFEQISATTCPMFFLTGELDNPSRNQPAREKLASLNIPTGLLTYEEGKHGCWNRLPWFSAMNDDIDRLLQQYLGP